MPSYAEEKGIRQREPKTEGEMAYRIKELESEREKRKKSKKIRKKDKKGKEKNKNKYLK